MNASLAKVGQSALAAPATPAKNDDLPVLDFDTMVDFSFNPYGSNRRIADTDDGGLTLYVKGRTGRGLDMPGPITIPAAMTESVIACMFECGEAVRGKAEMVDGRLVARVISDSALWTDCRGRWFDYVTMEPVDIRYPAAVAA